MNEYPLFFSEDVISKDTNLFPLLVIGGAFDWVPIGGQPNFTTPEADNFRNFLLLSTTNFNLKQTVFLYIIYLT